MPQYFAAALGLYCILTLVWCDTGEATTPGNQGRSSSTPVCVLDPKDESNLFSLVTAKGLPYINRSGVIGPLLESDFNASNRDNKKWSPPNYHFHQPADAALKFYDLALDDPTLGPLFVGMDAEFNAVLTDVSSNGFAPITDSQGRSVRTTVFSLSCRGKLSINVNAKTFIWEVRDKHTVFTKASGPMSAESQIWIRSKQSRESRIDAQRAGAGGAAPRCPSTPFGLYAAVRHPSREPIMNGCGSGATAGLVPDLIFGGCCNAHDYCYDACEDTFETCNGNFDGCLHATCDDAFPHWWDWFLWLGCDALADVYTWAVTTSIGIDSFVTSTQDRCECLCPSGSDLCAGRCPDFFTDSNNCGGCGNRCDPNIYCQYGSCNCYANIYGNDNNNCGACGRKCGFGYSCSQGACLCTADTSSDPNNCGSCGRRCPSGNNCEEGGCQCPPGRKCME